jgi:preprotein translocase subunit SecD
VPAEGRAIDPALGRLIDGSQLDSSQVKATTGPSTGEWVVQFGLNKSAADVLAEWTRGHIGSYLAIVLDGKVLWAPYIAQPILDGKGEISGLFSEQTAKRLAAVLKYGALPYPLQETESKAGW